MYLEEADLCWRAHRRGWGVVFEPSGWVTHVQGTATRRRPYRMIVAHHRSTLMFANRTTFGRRRLLLPAMAAGLVLRAGLACLSYWWQGRGRRLKADPVR
jgi:GT2 family glycosyltransferase